MQLSGAGHGVIRFGVEHVAARKPSSPYHHAGTTERIGSVAPEPVFRAPRPGPTPEELAEQALQAKREELDAIDAKLERRRQELERAPDTIPPKSGDHDRQLGLAVRTLLKQGATILATAVITTVIAVAARPAASPEKVEKVVDDQREGKKDTDERLKLCEDNAKIQARAQQVVNESVQDWIATLANKRGIDPGRPDDPWAKLRTAEVIEMQSVSLGSGKPPRFKAARPLPPVPPRP